ncbi:MAG: hypothetical protein M0Q87_10680 [Ottowia sp.]|nr:hypothetical protein [Ottowia sp.]
MKVWRQAFSVQRVHTTLNAQPLQTLNLPIMAAQPQSSMCQRGHPSCATPNAQPPHGAPPRFPADDR